MTDWKSVGIGALANVVLTMILTIVLFPLFFLGPVIGGLLTTYLSKERLSQRTPASDAGDGALSGVIGGLLIGAIFILGVSVLSTVIGLVFTQIGAVLGTITLITGLFFTLITIILGGVLGAMGGVIGYSMREKEYVQVKVN